MAKIPASTPGPSIATSNNAQIRELIEREPTMISKAIGRTNFVLGVVLRAAKKATGTAMINPIKVPRVAILMVSQSGHKSSFTKPHAGGIIREPISFIWAGASVTNAQIVSLVIT